MSVLYNEDCSTEIIADAVRKAGYSACLKGASHVKQEGNTTNNEYNSLKKRLFASLEEFGELLDDAEAAVLDGVTERGKHLLLKNYLAN